jgi:hypothetical protein
MYHTLGGTGPLTNADQRVMQVYNEGRLHFKEDGSTFFVGQPVMIRFKKLNELENTMGSSGIMNPNESSSYSGKTSFGCSTYDNFIHNIQHQAS